MDKRKQIEEILEKNRHYFITDMKGRLDRALYDLMEFCPDKNESDYKELKRFFHSVAGTAGTLQLTGLSLIASSYEEYMEGKGNGLFYAEDFYNLLNGLSKINGELKVLTEKHLQLPDANLTIDAGNANYTTLPSTASVLVVDDDIAMLDVLNRIFRMEGYYVAITSNPAEVTQILSKKNFDLVILDIMMPGMDGFEVFRQVRSGFPDIPVIFLTAKALKEYRIKALKSGVDDYVIKPFETEELLARVEAIILKTARNKKYIITDMLTGVYTKKFFNDDFKEFRARFVRKKEVFSIAFIDLDRFKEINDTYGHLVGDCVLKDFVKYLKDCLRINDHIFRFGGDEFLVLLSDTDSNAAYSIIERIREKLAAIDFLYEGVKQPLNLSFSSGITEYRDRSETPEQLIERSDKGLYMSKRAGRGRTSIFHETDRVEDKDRKRIFIIVDSEVIIRLIKTGLISLDYEIGYAYDGKKGLQAVGAFNPDLIIVDIMLPGITGFEVCRQIRNIVKNESVKIMILSSIKHKPTADVCIGLGINEYLEKPFTLEELETRIRKALD